MNIFFERITGLLPKQARLQEENKNIGYKYIRIDLSNCFRLGALDNIAYFDFSEVALKNVNIHNLTTAINSHSTEDRIRIIFLPDRIPFENYLCQLINVIMLDESAINDLIKHHNSKLAFREILLKYVDKYILNPYRHLGAVTGNIFFGRDRQLNAIINNPKKSFLVSGIRTSGKSSLLLQAKNKITGTAPNTNVAYVDCRSVSNISELLSRVLISLGERTNNSQPEKWPVNRTSEFGNKLKKIASDNRHGNVRIFLDEYDRVLQFEEKEAYQLTWAFRNIYHLNANNVGIVQFLIAGSKNLSMKCKENDSAFYNFFDYEETRLDNFDLGTITKILSEPLEDLGIIVTDPNAVSNQILRDTSGRPASVQYLCSKIAETVITNHKNKVDIRLINTITNSGGYTRHYSDTIYQNIDLLQKLILLICSQRNENEGNTFTIASMRNFMLKHGFRVDDKALRNCVDDLVNSGLLNEDINVREPRFTLAYSYLSKTIFSKLDYNSLITELLSDLSVTKL